MQYPSKQLTISLAPHLSERKYSIRRFEELFQIRYLPKLECENWRVESWLRKKCERAKNQEKIGQLALWLGKLHAKDIEKSDIPPVIIRWLGDRMGYGVFTTKPFKKWQFVGEYTGILRRKAFFHPNINDYCFMYPKCWFSPLKAFTIDSERQGNFTRFINHSDHPNCESVSIFYEGMLHIIFRAIQDIPEGAQLFYDYGDIYWNKRKKVEERPEDLVSPEALEKIQSEDFS